MIQEDNFALAEQKLQELASPGIRPGLARLSKLLSLAGNPERRFKAVHIVGTNGKGSTAASITSILRESGYKTALYTSPHLVSFGERLEIGGSAISPAKWSHFIGEIAGIMERCEFFDDDRPTYFELITAAAFMIIAEENVDIAVVEAGLGGRLDATNILKNVVLSVITPIGTDHTEYLGDSLLSIAGEKFAVMRRFVPAIFAGGEPEIDAAFFEHAAKSGARALLLRNLCRHGLLRLSLDGTDFYMEYDGVRAEYHSPLIGTFQADNSALAAAAAYTLRDIEGGTFAGIDISSIYKGIAKTSWPGRFEPIKKSPALILDGAHNPHAAKRLTETLLTIRGGAPLNIVLAMMSDKDIRESIELLKPLDPLVYCTEIPDMERSLASGELLKIAVKSGLRTAGCWNYPLDAVRAAVSAGIDTVCCGSLYLVGYVKARKDEI